MTAQPLAAVRSLKVKLGLLVVVSVVAAAAMTALARAGGVPGWLATPVTVALALALTQLLAVGMVAPLRQMTQAARRMATGDYQVRVTATSRDEVGELARAFNTMARDLAAVDTQRRELVANVSHELRTPLAGLCAVLDNLVDGVTPQDPATLRTALHQAERTARLVDDLLDLARVDAGKAPLTPQPVAVASLVASVVDEARLSGREVSTEVSVDPPDLVVLADPARLHQLVANLLDNAVRHSPAGADVAVSVTGGATSYQLEVRDLGEGVAREDRQQVFEPFGTLSETPGGGGTGLGLAIARWVTDLHGGRIGFVDPPSGSGACVRVDLPLAPPDRSSMHPSTPAFPARQEDVMTTAPPSTPAPAPEGSHPSAVAARPVLDELFGSFWPDRGVPARPAVVWGAVLTGLLGGLVLLDRSMGLGTFLVLLAAGGVLLLASRHRRDPFTITCGALSALLAGVTVLRDAEWIVVLCLLAGAGVSICGVTAARRALDFVVSGLAWPLAGLRGLPWLGRTLSRLVGVGHGAALLRTLVWSALGLVVFGALFVSADALLARWVDTVLPDLRVDTLVARGFISVFVGGTVLAAGYVALNPPGLAGTPSGSRPVNNRYEWLAPVLVVVGVFVAFLMAQATAFFGGHDYLEATTGLTYADYVHQGFGQLTVATALTLVVVWAAARKAPRATVADRGWLRGSLGSLCALTLVVVASALYRMHLYQEAYGFTRLRLLVDVFEGWLGLLMLAVVAAGVTLRAGWLPRFALVTGATALLALALLNPDRWIAEHNIARYEETGRVDWTYLQNLSDDAVPALSELPADVRSCALGDRTAARDDWLEWNLGRASAADLLPPTATTTTQPNPVTCPEDATSSLSRS